MFFNCFTVPFYVIQRLVNQKQKYKGLQNAIVIFDEFQIAQFYCVKCEEKIHQLILRGINIYRLRKLLIRKN